MEDNAAFAYLFIYLFICYLSSINRLSNVIASTCFLLFRLVYNVGYKGIEWIFNVTRSGLSSVIHFFQLVDSLLIDALWIIKKLNTT